MKTKITIGMKIGDLTVIEKTDRRASGSGSIYYLCKCICGNESTIIAPNLTKRGGTKSCGCRVKKSPGETTLNYLELVYRKNAEKRGFFFELTSQEFRHLISQKCYYCGFEGRRTNRYIKDNSIKDKTISEEGIERSWVTANGIDRKDNTKGYTLENSLPCCSDCNRAKMAKSFDEFINFIERIKGHTIG